MAGTFTARIVGRDAELADLRGAVDDLVRGQGSTVFITGAPGMGKTALAEPTLAHARERDLLVLRARAWPLDVDLAYAPILHAVGPALRTLSGPERHAMVDGLPDLGRLFTELHLPDAPTLGDAALEKTRLFESVARLFERLTAKTPTVLFIDDLHFADTTTIELLHYLIRRLCDAPILIAGTMRPSAAHETLTQLVRHAQLEGTARTLALHPLDRPALRALAEQFLEGPPADDLVDLLQARSQGTPFFALAMLATLQRRDKLVKIGGEWRPARGASEIIPPQVRQLLAGAIQSFDAQRRSVVEHLAVAGTEVSLRTLTAVCSVPEDALVELLDRLCGRGVVTEVADDGGQLCYALAHPLSQEVIYEEMPEARRRAAHRRFLGMNDSAAPELARHVRGLGPDVDDPQRALSILEQAANFARERWAHGESAKWLSAAVDLARRQGWNDRLGALLEPLGDARAATSDLVGATEAWTEAIQRRPDEAAATAAMRGRLCLLLWELGRLDEATALLHEGIADLERDGPSEALARLSEVGFRIALRRGDVQWLRNKLATPARWNPAAGDTFEELFLAVLRYMSEGRLGDALRSAQAAKKAATTVAQRIRAENHVLGARVFSGLMNEQDLVDYRRLAEEVGVPALTYSLPLLAGYGQFWRGNFSAAICHWEDVLAETPTDRYLSTLYACIATARALRGELPAAERLLDRAQSALGRFAGDLHAGEAVAVAEAVVAIEIGDTARSRSCAEPMRLGQFNAWGATLRAHAWFTCGELERAEAAADDAQHQLGDLDLVRGGARRIHGLVAAARGDTSGAAKALTDAVQAFMRVDMPFFAARARLDLASLPDTPPAAAREAAWACLDVFERSGAQRYHERTRALLRALGDAVPLLRATSPDAPLSERELEVARLAAAGCTNAQIGKALFISPHTAATHMKKIYGRTGVHNRTALATWLRDHDLLEG